jgi:hypothetical protein
MAAASTAGATWVAGAASAAGVGKGSETGAEIGAVTALACGKLGVTGLPEETIAMATATLAMVRPPSIQGRRPRSLFMYRLSSLDATVRRISTRINLHQP